MDELEALLKESLKHARRAKAKKPKHKFILKSQAELEWEVGQTVVLIHRADDGFETALGLFIEYTRPGTRWLRPTADTLSPHHQEIVTGNWWLHPKIREIPMEPTWEAAALRSRFEELMKEIDVMFPVEDEQKKPTTIPENPDEDPLFEDEEDEDEDEFEDEDDDTDEDDEDE